MNTFAARFGRLQAPFDRNNDGTAPGPREPNPRNSWPAWTDEPITYRLTPTAPEIPEGPPCPERRAFLAAFFGTALVAPAGVALPAFARAAISAGSSGPPSSGLLAAGSGGVISPAIAVATGAAPSPIMEAYGRMLRTFALAEAFRADHAVEFDSDDWDVSSAVEDAYSDLGRLHSVAERDLVHRIAAACGLPPSSLATDWKAGDGREYEPVAAHREGGKLFLLVRCDHGGYGCVAMPLIPECELYVRPIVVDLKGVGQ